MFRLIAVARPVIEKHGSAVQRAQIYQFLALASVRRDRYVVSDEVVTYAHGFFSAVEELGDASRLPAARFGLGGMLLWRGDLDASEQHLRAVLDTVERTGDVSLEARCVTYLAIIHRQQGQADAVRAYAERGLRIATAATMPDYIGAAYANLAWLAWRAGDLAEAEALGHKAISTWQATSLVFASQWTALWPLIGVALAANQITTVVKLARALLDDGQQRPPAQFEMALEAAIRAGETGAPELARAEIERVFESARAAGYL
jgi:tetratricopeptide (TPR) repeat protein